MPHAFNFQFFVTLLVGFSYGLYFLTVPWTYPVEEILKL